jgi:hypothetical protein
VDNDDQLDYPPYHLYDGWWCIVEGKAFGPWPDKGAALAGYQTECRRRDRKRVQDEAVAP